MLGWIITGICIVIIIVLCASSSQAQPGSTSDTLAALEAERDDLISKVHALEAERRVCEREREEARRELAEAKERADRLDTTLGNLARKAARAVGRELESRKEPSDDA